MTGTYDGVENVMNDFDFDALIVGSGFCGSVIARLLAEEKKKRVLVIDKRNCIGGNMYDKIDSNGILVQQYGPHVFHTNNEKVISFLTTYDEWSSYKLKYLVDLKGNLFSMPFNFSIIDYKYDTKQGTLLKNTLKKLFPFQESVSIVDLLRCNEPIVYSFAQYLFEEDYRPYTTKQWGISPEDIDISVLNRVPFLLSYRDHYNADRYECLPKHGYTAFFKKLLAHPLILVKLEALASDIISIKNNNLIINDKISNIPIIYTGAVDELLEYKYGILPYRSLRFKNETKFTKSYQPAAVIAYPKAIGYTRVTEYRKLPYQDVGDKTTIVREYPLEWKPNSIQKYEPCYPVLTKESQKIYLRYLEELKEIPNLYLCGRLADFKYYNMDEAIERSMYVYRTIRF